MAEKKFTLDDEPAAQNPGATTPAAIPPDVAAHADEIAGASPEVQQHAIDEHARQETATESTAEKDVHGTPFDDKIHTGSKLKSGEWRKRKSTLGSPPKKAAEAKQVSGALVMSEAQESQSRMAGAAAASMMFSSLTMIFGDEWQPRKEKDCGFDENKLTSQAFGDYFVSKGVTDFPPGVTLSFVLLGYFAARAQMPKTRSKLQMAKSAVSLWWQARKLRAEFKRKNIALKVEVVDGVILVDGKPNNAAK